MYESSLGIIHSALSFSNTVKAIALSQKNFIMCEKIVTILFVGTSTHKTIVVEAILQQMLAGHSQVGR